MQKKDKCKWGPPEGKIPLWAVNMLLFNRTTKCTNQLHDVSNGSLCCFIADCSQNYRWYLCYLKHCRGKIERGEKRDKASRPLKPSNFWGLRWWTGTCLWEKMIKLSKTYKIQPQPGRQLRLQSLVHCEYRCNPHTAERRISQARPVLITLNICLFFLPQIFAFSLYTPSGVAFFRKNESRLITLAPSICLGSLRVVSAKASSHSSHSSSPGTCTIFRLK